MGRTGSVHRRGSEPAPAISSGTTRSLQYVRGLDGLRGVAVLAVVLYHFAPSVLPGGFLGVDVFFVLSGFLIASLLTREAVVTRNVRLGHFWIRRARRLMPALLAVLAALSVYAAWFANENELARLRSHGLATLGYFANWRFIADGTSYTDLFTGPSPLLHTWSLAIEEQFYLVFPLLVFGALLVARRRPEPARRLIVAAATLGIVASAVTMAVEFRPNEDPSRVYFGTDTRVHMLLVGVILGVVLQGAPPARHSSRWLGRLGVASGALVTAAFLVAGETDAWLYRGGFLLFALCVASVIAGSRRSLVVRSVLEAPPLVALGVISYGVYLWHWPVFLLIDQDTVGIGGFALFLLRSALTLGISLLSYWLIERPIRQGAIGRRLGRGAIVVAPAAIGVLALVVVATTVVAPLQISEAATRPPPSVSPNDADQGPVRIVMLGDSVAHTLAGGDFNSTAPWDPSQSPYDPSRVEVWSAAKQTCAFLPGVFSVPNDSGNGYKSIDFHPYCGDWEGDLDKISKRFLPDYITVFLANDMADELVDGRIVKFGTPEHDQMLFELFDQISAIATRNGAQVVFLTPPLEKSDRRGLSERGGWRQRKFAEVLKAYVVTHPEAHIIDLASYVCPHDDCAHPGPGFREEDRTDGLHYNKEGARAVAKWLTPQLEELREPPMRVVMLGDSVAHTLAGGVIQEFPNWIPWDPSQSPYEPSRVELWSAAKPGCVFLPGLYAVPLLSGSGYQLIDFHKYCGDWQGDLDKTSKLFLPDYVTVFLSNDTADLFVDGRIVSFGTPEHDQMLFELFDQISAIATRNGAEVVFLTPPLEKSERREMSERGGWRQLQLAELMNEYVATHPEAHIIDLASYVCPQGDCSHPGRGFREEDRTDGLHYSAEGARAVAKWLTPRLEELRSSG